MPDDFQYDVFLSHSSKDKKVVRNIAERLKKDGVKVWFDEWILKPGDNIPAKIEEGLEHSRVLVLCMSANAFGSDWAQLESGTFRFRDPLNKDRRFLPLRLDNVSIKGSLAQFLYINWSPAEREQAYKKLINTIGPRQDQPDQKISVLPRIKPLRRLKLKGRNAIECFSFSKENDFVVTGGYDNSVRKWSLKTGQANIVYKAISYKKSGSIVWSVALAGDESMVLLGDHDNVWVLSLEADEGEYRLRGGEGGCYNGVAWNQDCDVAISGSMSGLVEVWDTDRYQHIASLDGHKDIVRCVAINRAGTLGVSGSDDGTLRLWDLKGMRCLQVFEGHLASVNAVALTDNEQSVISAGNDGTIRIWAIKSGLCMHVLTGHSDQVNCVALSSSGEFLVSGSNDRTVRLWSLKSASCVAILEGHKGYVQGLGLRNREQKCFSADKTGLIFEWDLSAFIENKKLKIESRHSSSPNVAGSDQIRYTNAKVLLVGESGAGKTGLSKRLALNDWHPTDSTVGAWATQWKLPVSGGKGAEREIWLWDFGGQADQRLIHQLYMDETALAVLVFDGQKEDLFETLGQWDRDLIRAARKEFAKLLVAGRVDAGGLRASRSEVEKFATERKFRGFLETSAKQNLGCEELKQAILDTIPWDELPCLTTKVLFKQLKEEIIALKDEGRVLLRFNELRETMQLRLSNGIKRFTDEELHAVLTLLAGPGVVWELTFGSWLLLQPERINAYAQAVIRTLQADEHQRGCLLEEQVLKGELMYESSIERLQGDEERFVLLAMHQTLVERGLCLRQPTPKGNLLVFPSYYRKERPDIVQHPSVQVNYRFTGFLDELYATLVVRLHHSDAFEQDALWRYAADFKTNTGKQLGIKLTRRAPGVGDLEVYFDTAVCVEEKIIFSKYVHEHLLQHARDVERLRHYVCPECGTPVGNREVAMKRLNDWLLGQPPETSDGFRLRSDAANPPTIICVGCEQRVPLWDEIEQCFASAEIQQRVSDMQLEAAIELDNESKERALVGEVISTVALAAQISREKNVSDHGIDMEIEFKDDAYEATNRMLYLQLKSGDSYTRKRKKDGTEIFTIKDERHVRYWMASAFPVMLVIRNSEGEVRWMEIRDWLKRESDNGKKPVKQIVFEGERFDVMSVRRWRDKILGAVR